jgi:hypothetical protein
VTAAVPATTCSLLPRGMAAFADEFGRIDRRIHGRPDISSTTRSQQLRCAPVNERDEL